MRRFAGCSRPVYKGLGLLSSKQSPPQSPRFLVRRERLDERFRSLAHARVILVVAPAGFGKTSMLSHWKGLLGAEGVACAWLTLDEGDNDAGRFLAYLSHVVNAIAPEPESEGVVRGRLGEGAASTLLFGVLQKIETCGPFTLFLDEFNSIEDPEALDILRRVILHLGEGQKVVLATRKNPDLGLARVRVRGELEIFDAGDLSFTLDETDRFLRSQYGLSLGPAEVEKLHKGTEGWIAGLQLAALALASNKSARELIDSFSGSSNDVAEYLAEEVFSRQKEEIRAFMLETSVLERLNAKLCDAVTGRDDSHEILAHLERSNLFLLPLDNEKRWYRYHNLLAQFLGGRLESTDYRKVPRIKAAASEWFAANGNLVEAANYALAAGNFARAGEFMSECAIDLVNRGQGRTVLQWAAHLSMEALEANPKLLFACAVAQILRNRYEEAEDGLNRLQKLAEAGGVSAIDLEHINASRTTFLVVADRLDECKVFSERILQKTTRRGPRAVIANSLGLCMVAEGRFDEAQGLFRTARALASKTGNLIGETYAQCFEGRVQMLEGNMKEAVAFYRAAMKEVHKVTTGYSVPGAIAVTFLAEALYEMNELNEAEALLGGYGELIADSSSMSVVAIASRTLSRLHLAEGRIEEAAKVAADTEHLALRRNAPRRFLATSMLDRGWVLFRAGDIEGAKMVVSEVERMGEIAYGRGKVFFASDPEAPEMSALRLMIHTDNARKALPFLRTELSKASALRCFGRAVKLKILLALALRAVDDKGAALRLLRDAILEGRAKGFARIYLDEGLALSRMIQELGGEGARDSEEDPALDEIFFEAGQGHLSGKGGVSPPTGEFPVEITDREREVLTYLAQGYSNQALADKLFVSETTVRYHLRNIYAKLGAKNRTQAVALARRFGAVG